MMAWIPEGRGWLWRRLAAVCKVICAAAVMGALTLALAVLPFPYPVEKLAPDQGGPLLILDRNGTLLYSVPGAGGNPGRHSWIGLDRLPPHVLLTFLASEDSRFFEHAGVDPWGVLRAVWLNLRAGRKAFGGSTITMQLVKNVHHGGRPRTYLNKLKEVIYALRLERAMGKRMILEQYINRVYFGNGAFGIEAAARTYFEKPSVSLSVAESALLAVIPRGPVTYNPLQHLHRALERRDHVLGLLVKKGLLSAEEARRARAQRLPLALNRPTFLAPHFVDWIRATLPPEARRTGGKLWTTLDLPLQQQLQRRVTEHVDSLRERGLSQAGMVVLDSATGEVLAMVGSAGYRGPRGQINSVIRRRHPGSALKPFVYALALEGGDSPASIAYDVHDVPSAYRVQSGAHPEHGPVRYREALAGSYNLAAIHVLERVGVDRLLSRLRLGGLGPLDGAPGDYGLRLALGSAKVRLIDLAAAYGFLVRDGSVTSPTALLRLERWSGEIWRPRRVEERRLFSPQVSWLAMDMLSDPEARRPAFGQELPFDLPFKVAAKTGTSRGFADTVAVAATQELTVAAWAGNFDGKPTQGLVAMQSAAPLVRAGLLITGRGQRLTLPGRPRGLVSATVCPLSGKLATEDCPHRTRDYSLPGHTTQQRCTWHRRAGGQVAVRYPRELIPWASRQRQAGGRHL